MKKLGLTLALAAILTTGAFAQTGGVIIGDLNSEPKQCVDNGVIIGDLTGVIIGDLTGVIIGDLFKGKTCETVDNGVIIGD